MEVPNPYQTPAAQPGMPGSVAAKPTLWNILFSFQGRIPRRTYWLWLIAPVVMLVLIVGLTAPLLEQAPAAVGPETPPVRSSMSELLFLALLIPLFWIRLAVSVKRWHDLGKSGWWYLIGLIPLVGGIWVLIECGCTRGNFGPNQYGDDPT